MSDSYETIVGKWALRRSGFWGRKSPKSKNWEEVLNFNESKVFFEHIDGGYIGEMTYDPGYIQAHVVIPYFDHKGFGFNKIIDFNDPISVPELLREILYDPHGNFTKYPPLKTNPLEGDDWGPAV